MREPFWRLPEVACLQWDAVRSEIARSRTAGVDFYSRAVHFVARGPGPVKVY